MASPGRRTVACLLLTLHVGVFSLRFGDPIAARKGDSEMHGRSELPSREEIAKLPPDGGPEFNRLIHESSPYLLQHARNPVDWYPCGDEAFDKARREDKPVFLSIGYSTCHWCHVMEHESFENDVIARLMNEQFVSIKVDREERPDVDNVYMAAVQAMTGSGGWPMSVFLTPDGNPFWGGTYFPPEYRLGRPGFRAILALIADAWRNRRGELLAGAQRLTEHIRSVGPASGRVEIGAATLGKAYELYARLFDATYGGFGEPPKFPRSHSLSFLLRYWKRTGEERALSMVETTLDRMWRGGVHDHLGGGFHRYSADRTWFVPHFEKMLYDQALIARTYLEAHQATGKREYAKAAADTLDYVLRDMTDEAGGFYSAEDADSEGVEGKFYVWTKAEISVVLGREDGELFSRVYGLEEDGNYRNEATGKATGFNILHVPRPVEQIAGELGIEAPLLEESLSRMRRKLLDARGGRIRPHRDDKVLADWNGLMISALACGGQVLEDPRYVEAARRAASFLLETMCRGGRLLHRYRNGSAAIKAYLDDYAFLCLGLLDLYETTFEVRWLREGKRLAEEMVELFWDAEGKGFYFSGSDAEQLLARTKEFYDGSIPSGNSASTMVLLRLGRLTMDADLERRAGEALELFSGQIDQSPMGYPFMLMGLDFAVGPSKELVLAGDMSDQAMRAMIRAMRLRFLPNKVVAFNPTDRESTEIQELIPYLRHQQAIGGEATAYVCENYTCNLPTKDVEVMISLLTARREV